MGIKIDATDGIKVDFSGSDIQGLEGLEAVVNRVINRMAETRRPDAYDIHRLKKYIDENVGYGPTGASGLKGKVERVLKTLRRDLDQTLDSSFYRYNEVNSIYSETRAVLDSLQDIAGKKSNLSGANSDKDIGTLLRRTLGNARSRVRLLESMESIENAAKKYGGKDINAIEGKGLGSNDLKAQILFADELDRVFGPVARTSFQGQVDQAVQRGARATTSQAGAADAAIGVAGKLAEKARNINEDAAFKSIRDLLSK